MTAGEFSHLPGRSGAHHAYGWFVSMLSHVLVIGCVILLMTEIEKPILSNSFQWEVSLVQAQTPVEPVPPEKPPVTPVVPPPRPPVTPVQRTVDHTVHDVVVPIETVQPIQQLAQDVVTQADPVMERVEPTYERAVSVEQAAPLVDTTSSAIEHRIIQQRLVSYRQIQADYGWLRDALWERIEALKRYPAQARANHWEGKVVVEAVIREDGGVIELRIAESSGHAILDQEAMAVMKKASPLTLKHPLGKPRVTILIPISYRLDG